MGIPLYDEELKIYLGSEFYAQICLFVQQGSLNPEREKLEDLNRALNPGQAGKFQNSRATGRLAIREILSVWFNSYPREVQNNGRQIFLDVLTDPNVDLPVLANKLTENKTIPQAQPFRPSPSSSSTPVGKRTALIFGNTYSAEGKSNLKPLPGCKISAENVKQALEAKRFICQLEIDVPADELLDKVTEFTKKNKDSEARLLYFSGHGGNESFTIKSDGKSVSAEQVQFTGSTGKMWEGGDYVMGDDGVKVFKDQVLSRFNEDSQPGVHKILMFDCCRGESATEMGAAQGKPFLLNIMKSEEAGQKNAHYKNVIILHSTLPHQVAWCEAVGKGPTKFSKHFCTQIEQASVNINGMDEAINAGLEKDQEVSQDTKGHVQMVEMTKRGISRPFIF